MGKTRRMEDFSCSIYISVHQLSRTLQCTSISEGGGFDFDQSWLCAM